LASRLLLCWPLAMSISLGFGVRTRLFCGPAHIGSPAFQSIARRGIKKLSEETHAARQQDSLRRRVRLF
jgi:hypothetical protein